jgi:predicted protein tyrosine phosphatase
MRQRYDEVHDNIAIGGIKAVEESSTSHFDRIVSVCQDAADQNVSDETPYIHIPLADGDDDSRERGTFDYETFEAGALAVLDGLRAGQQMLVHCHAGQHRSPAVSAAAVAVSEGRGYGETIHSFRNERPQIVEASHLREYGFQFVEDYRTDSKSYYSRRPTE